MRVSTKGRYALRIMIDLALNNNGEYIPLKDISARQGITIKYMEQIIPQLNKAGYLKSLRGNRGGYRLAKTPDKYIAGDILRVMEGSLATVACLDYDEVDCERSNNCSTLKFWNGLKETVNNYVNSFTLADIINDINDTQTDNLTEK